LQVKRVRRKNVTIEMREIKMIAIFKMNLVYPCGFSGIFASKTAPDIEFY